VVVMNQGKIEQAPPRAKCSTSRHRPSSPSSSAGTTSFRPRSPARGGGSLPSAPTASPAAGTAPPPAPRRPGDALGRISRLDCAGRHRRVG
jgi:hypothetical protein